MPEEAYAEPKKINEILAMRTDLSIFLVHLINLTENAKDALISIVTDGYIENRNPWGMLKTYLNEYQQLADSQKSVCFTETPLEHLWSLCGGVDDCDHHPRSNYGIILTKNQARKAGVNPVWYIDQTPGHEWLSNVINSMIKKALEDEVYTSEIFKLTPFFESMGSWEEKKKEFWWEREWRYVGKYKLPDNFILVAPEKEHKEIKSKINQAKKCFLIDHKWSIEQMVAHLAHFDHKEIIP